MPEGNVGKERKYIVIDNAMVRLSESIKALSGVVGGASSIALPSPTEVTAAKTPTPTFAEIYDDLPHRILEESEKINTLRIDLNNLING